MATGIVHFDTITEAAGGTTGNVIDTGSVRASTVSVAQSAVAGAKTFAQIKSEVARYVMAPDSERVRDVAGDGIVDAVRRINSREWEQLLTPVEIALEENVREYKVPGNFKAPRTLQLLLLDRKPTGYLQYMDPKTFQLNFANVSPVGQPTHYTAHNANYSLVLTLNRKPSLDWVVSTPYMNLWYYRRLELPRYDSDVLTYPPEWESFVAWWGKAYIASVYDPSRHVPSMQMAQGIWQELIIGDKRVQEHDWSEG